MGYEAWEEFELSQLLDVKHGFAFKGEYFKKEPPGDILLTPGNFAIGGGFKYDKLKYYDGPVPEDYVLDAGDLLVTMTDLSKAADTLGYPAIVPEPEHSERYLHNQRLGLVQIKKRERLHKEFLYYLMCSRPYRRDIVAGATGTTVKHTSPTKIKRFRARVPPFLEQLAIADILGTLDGKIELNRQMNRTLEAMARAIFKAWFVDFEPVKAKAAGATSFRGMPQAVFDQLPDRFTDSELGPVPAGWEVKPIGSVASISRESVTPADSPDETFEHFSIPAFDAGMRPAKGLGSSIKSNKYAVSPDCVLVSKLNPRFARVWLPDEPENGERQICSTEFLVISPKEGWSREYLYCQFVEAGFRQDLQQRASGTSNSHQRIKPKDFERTLVVSPPAEVREAFLENVGPFFAKAANDHNESQTLAALRNTLLPKLISGELRVPLDAGDVDGS